MMKALFVALLLAGMLACGPSAKEIETARNATYTCELQEVFDAVVAQMKTQGAIAGAAANGKAVTSEFRWHTANGVPHKRGAAVVGSGDLAFSVMVAIDGSQGTYRVLAAPKVLAHVVGSPAGEELDPEDGDWPDWADEKVNVLVVDIYKRLKHCANTPR